MWKQLGSGAVIIFLLSIVFSMLPISIAPNTAYYNTVFTVIGIFYSIGYSIALGFDYCKIENKDYAFRIRSEVKRVIHSFTANLSFAAVLFILINFIGASGPNQLVLQYGWFRLSVDIFFAVSLTYILGYLVYNFFRLQKLKDDLDDKIRKDIEQ